MRKLERFIVFIVGDREEMMFRNKEVVISILDAKPLTSSYSHVEKLK